MRTIRFTMFLFYRYYTMGRYEFVPYFRTLCAMAFLFFLHVGALLCWLDKGDLLFGENKNAFTLKFIALFSISIFIFWRLASERELQLMEYEEQKIKRGGWVLVVYFILAMAVLFLGIIF